MATNKTPSVRSQLIAAKKEINELVAGSQQLQKKLDTAESAGKYNAARAEKAEAELLNIGAFLDAVPNPPPRKTDPAVTGDSYARDINVATRLSVFLATRG